MVCPPNLLVRSYLLIMRLTYVHTLDRIRIQSCCENRRLGQKPRLAPFRTGLIPHLAFLRPQRNSPCHLRTVQRFYSECAVRLRRTSSRDRKRNDHPGVSAVILDRHKLVVSDKRIVVRGQGVQVVSSVATRALHLTSATPRHDSSPASRVRDGWLTNMDSVSCFLSVFSCCFGAK